MSPEGYLATSGLPKSDCSSGAGCCALALTKLLPPEKLDARLQSRLDALSAREASLRSALEAHADIFVVHAHLAYCTKCEEEVPLATHYSLEDWEQHLNVCASKSVSSPSDHQKDYGLVDVAVDPDVSKDDEAPTANADSRDEVFTAQSLAEPVQSVVVSKNGRDALGSRSSTPHSSPAFKDSPVHARPTSKSARDENNHAGQAQRIPATKGSHSRHDPGKTPLGRSRMSVNNAGYPTTENLTIVTGYKPSIASGCQDGV
ncbi:hypothetical protein HDZ31DRAFT_68719 [Schizophyllum fasciatum]